MSNFGNLGSIPLQPGEILPGEDYERPLSAPPGFGAGAEGRNHMADELVWGSPVEAVGGTVKDDLLHHHLNGANGTAASFSVGAIAGINSSMLDARTSSFSNLAAVLGTGLVESMEDATQDRNNSSNNFPGTDELSYNRMKRHAASRLIGQSPPKFSDPVLPPHVTGAAGGNSGPLDFLYPQQQYEQKNRTDAFVNSRAPGEARDASAQLHHDAQGSRGFQWSPLSDAAVQAENEQVARRSTTPVQMFPGQHRALPATKDIGMNVMEPEGENQFSRAFTGVVSQRIDLQQSNQPSDPTVGSDSNRSIKELERGMQNMWSPEAREFKPASAATGFSGLQSDNSSISEPGSEISPRQAETELQPFLWDTDTNEASRTLAILHVSWVRVPDIRAACETFGVVESFRADFASRGIFFVSYYDIRSAQYASVELQPILQRLSVMQRSSEEVIVRYCLSLGTSSQFDESQIVISNLPYDINEYALKTMLASYGAIRSVVYQDDGSYLIEFQNLQDAKQALLELDSSQPWGSQVIFEVRVRNSIEKKCGRDLMALIGRWRHGMLRENSQHAAVDAQQYQRGGLLGQSADLWRRDVTPSHQLHEAQHQPQYVLGPDGRFTQVIVPNPAGYSQYGSASIDTRHQQVIQGANGQMYIATMPQHPNYVPQHGLHRPVATGAPYGDRRMQHSSTPYYAHTVTTDANSLSGRSHRSAHSHGTEGGEKDNRHLMMDLELVEIGQETRTSLMVRNIPNKYTQQMLLSEFEANGHGPGVIDFFYLPIDFKNRCNRGYAFINFVDYNDIIAFHRRYYGKHWRTFNSDKICDITYARIQGKDAMLKRFENSALMEKDDEYKPLVFASEGPTKGTRLPFPDPLLNNKKGRTEV